jgi:hypothetical protein
LSFGWLVGGGEVGVDGDGDGDGDQSIYWVVDGTVVCGWWRDGDGGSTDGFGG